MGSREAVREGFMEEVTLELGLEARAGFGYVVMKRKTPAAGGRAQEQAWRWGPPSSYGAQTVSDNRNSCYLLSTYYCARSCIKHFTYISMASQCPL